VPIPHRREKDTCVIAGKRGWKSNPVNIEPGKLLTPPKKLRFSGPVWYLGIGARRAWYPTLPDGP
jgi:hypothetical protein